MSLRCAEKCELLNDALAEIDELKRELSKFEVEISELKDNISVLERIIEENGNVY